jgi:hypothetical protein
MLTSFFIPKEFPIAGNIYKMFFLIILGLTATYNIVISLLIIRFLPPKKESKKWYPVG